MSDSDEECDCPAHEEEGEGWVITFADLMSLLMCFFVLLLSFAETDTAKYKQLAGSMAQSFGVQNKLKVMEIPKGTSIMAQEFSPGRPEPTPINEIWQKTDDLTEMSLEVECSKEYELEHGDVGMEAGAMGGGGAKADLEDKLKQLAKATEQDAVDIAEAMKDQIKEGAIEVETKGRIITIRLKEQGSFESGSAQLKPKYIPMLADVKEILIEKAGSISIEGHTDDIPVKSSRYRSNWDLSSARSASVAHELLKGDILNPERIGVSGYAGTRPMVPNDTVENRAKNRRVEIVIYQGWDKTLKKNVQDLQMVDPAYYESLKLSPREKYELQKDDIF